MSHGDALKNSHSYTACSINLFQPQRIQLKTQVYTLYKIYVFVSSGILFEMFVLLVLLFNCPTVAHSYSLAELNFIENKIPPLRILLEIVLPMLKIWDLIRTRLLKSSDVI